MNHEQMNLHRPSIMKIDPQRYYDMAEAKQQQMNELGTPDLGIEQINESLSSNPKQKNQQKSAEQNVSRTNHSNSKSRDQKSGHNSTILEGRKQVNDKSRSSMAMHEISSSDDSDGERDRQRRLAHQKQMRR